MKHYFTIDVEDWFQVYYAENLIDRHSWSTQPSKIHAMLLSLLELLDVHRVKGTFFFVGWIAKHHPALIRLVSERGHEIASHGFWHQEYYGKTSDVLSADIRDAKAALEDAIGRPVRGFRAPGFSIQSEKSPAIDLIQEAGHTYDSSVFSAQERPYAIRKGLLEVPPNSLRIGSKCLPAGGGFVFRTVPYPIFKSYVRHLENHGLALNFYTHTWEILTEYPRLPLGAKKSFIQYFNLARTRSKVARLLKDFSFAPIEACLGNQL